MFVRQAQSLLHPGPATKQEEVTVEDLMYRKAVPDDIVQVKKIHDKRFPDIKLLW